MFQKAKCLKHQLEKNNTLLNNYTKFIQNTKKHYDVITKYCTDLT